MARGGSKPSTARGTASKKPPSATQSKRQDEGTAEGATTDDPPSVPIETQQACLNIFQQALAPAPGDSALLQEIKGHLYNRDFAAAFGKDEYLRVYASRWSPSRALGYLQVLRDLQQQFQLLQFPPGNEVDGNHAFQAVCFGGGAGGELVALAAWWSMACNEDPSTILPILQIHLVDMADWAPVIDTLTHCLTTAPPLSQYASQARKDDNRPIIPSSSLNTHSILQDVLESTEARITTLVADVHLVTFMFTLNELYSTSAPKTQRLLTRLTLATRPGTRLLVVDSPGNYSTVSVNGAEKKYPMHWLLDRTLLGDGSVQHPGAEWRKLVEDGSRWFRLPRGLRYAMELENMRFQVHLYERLPGVVQT